MEGNRMRNRGFLKGKLVPFYRAPKPSSTMQYNTTTTTTTKMKPSQASPSPASVGYVVHQDYVIENIAQPKSKVTFVVADNKHDLVGQLEAMYGMAGDESVDTKAAVYISAVQERLKHEQVNSERIKLQIQDK